MQIKILSWNIWMDGNFKLIAEFLHSSNADIIGLQEVVLEDRNRDIVRFLTEAGYYFAISDSREARLDDMQLHTAIFSKYKIRGSRTHILSAESRRVAVEAAIEVENTLLNVFALHILHTHQKESPVQNLQIENLIKVLPKEKVIVLGDFNATPGMTPIKRICEVLINTDPSVKPTWSLAREGCKTCNLDTPDIRLDYIFISSDLKTHSPKVEDGRGSDHLPISVIVEV